MITTIIQTTSTEPVVTPMMRPLTLPVENKQFLYISTYMYVSLLLLLFKNTYTIKSGNHVNKVCMGAQTHFSDKINFKKSNQ